MRSRSDRDRAGPRLVHDNDVDQTADKGRAGGWRELSEQEEWLIEIVRSFLMEKYPSETRKDEVNRAMRVLDHKISLRCSYYEV